MSTTILGIESSCDDTSAAVIRDTLLLSNVMASQRVHQEYGGVVPELASRAHQQNIVPVVTRALQMAGVEKEELDAIAFTRGPGLLGSLLVGTSFAKGLSLALNKPIIEVNHLTGHVLSHFVQLPDEVYAPPAFPFLCLLVSGGHTQILQVNSPLHYTILGQTIDDAVGEAFDKGAKILGLPYPGGPVVDKLAKEGDAQSFRFAKPKITGLDYSFSGIKTSLLYFLRDRVAKDPHFIEQNITHLCASWQQHLIDILLEKLLMAARECGITRIALAGGVSANSGLRERMKREAQIRNWSLFLPPIRFTTDNAAMIAITGYFKYREGLLCGLDVSPVSRAREFEAM